MKIAFMHYHLKTGGVTTVLKQQVEAISDSNDALILTGELPELPFGVDIQYIPGLGYDSFTKTTHTSDEVAGAIIKVILAKWKNGCDLLHVHNPTLAKNKNFLKILKHLQKNNIRLFLQIHDFAEDGRPLLYFPDEYVPDCHYGVINSRDYQILIDAGLQKEGLHIIPNTITPFEFKSEDMTTEKRVVYPIRALRRKNIGEAILLSMFFKNKESLAITLPPNSAPDIKRYLAWKEFVKAKNLNVVFDDELTHEFKALVLASDFLITTSISEGFGFSFLEPWTAQKLLWGRKLTPICRDFEKNGVNLDHLYTHLLVPVEWIDATIFYEKWKSCIIKSCERFNVHLNQEKIDSAFEKTIKNGTIDFGLLDERFQKQIIDRLLSDEKNTIQLIRINPFLSHPGDIGNNQNLIQNNRYAVLNHYNKERYRKMLIATYAKVLKKKVRHRIDKHILVRAFLNPEAFSLLKWSDSDE
jgi:glycosyltransferase involved in cell wall biosynthesis